MTRQIPMLFSPAMVEALLAGRKTETRRIVPAPSHKGVLARPYYPAKVNGSWLWCARDGIPDHGVIDEPIRKARTQVGDLIWIKETHYAYGYWRATGETTKTGRDKVEFVRDGEQPVSFVDHWRKPMSHDPRIPRWNKRPSLFMPKADSRLTLRVTGFGIERLHDIDEAGAWAEGCISGGTNENGKPFPAEIPHSSGIGYVGWDSALDWYADLWDEINGPDAWDENQWVSVTKFEVIRQNVGEVAK